MRTRGDFCSKWHKNKHLLVIFQTPGTPQKFMHKATVDIHPDDKCKGANPLYDICAGNLNVAGMCQVSIVTQ